MDLPKPPPSIRSLRTRAAAINRHIANRIRQRRSILGLSQQHLAEQIGVTYQQVHKYEKGINNANPGRLALIADVLCVPIQYFFDEMPEKDGLNDGLTGT